VARGCHRDLRVQAVVERGGRPVVQIVWRKGPAHEAETGSGGAAMRGRGTQADVCLWWITCDAGAGGAGPGSVAAGPEALNAAGARRGRGRMAQPVGGPAGARSGREPCGPRGGVKGLPAAGALGVNAGLGFAAAAARLNPWGPTEPAAGVLGHCSADARQTRGPAADDGGGSEAAAGGARRKLWRRSPRPGRWMVIRVDAGGSERRAVRLALAHRHPVVAAPGWGSAGRRTCIVLPPGRRTRTGRGQDRHPVAVWRTACTAG